MKNLLFFAVALLAAVPAHAQPKLLQAHAAAPTYQGVGDVISGWDPYYALRGYSGAFSAPGTGKSVNVRRASDNSTQDIVILSNGNFDVAGYNTFVGTDATASCTIAGTSAVCTGASATLHVADVVTGTGISKPCSVTVTNGSTTATVSLTGTSTTCGTVSVAETVTFQVAGFVPTAYNQNGSSGNAVQATAANQPQLLPDCGNSLPCMFWSTSASTTLSLATMTTAAQPFNFTSVSKALTAQTNNLIAAPSSFGCSISNPGGNFGNPLAAGCGTNVSSSVTSVAGTLYAIQFLANGATSAINVGGTDTVAAGGAGTAAQPLWIGSQNSSGILNGYIDESGILRATSTPTDRNSICANQRAYWTTAGSC